jgi:hypothetical protein
MTVMSTTVPLLVFEAADCLMAIPAAEVAHLRDTYKKRVRPFFGAGEAFDLGEYFGGRQSDGPWLRWGRGPRSAWLRVFRVVDVVPTALSSLTPMPARLRGHRRTGAFLAAGVRGNDVFLLLDPARLAL